MNDKRRVYTIIFLSGLVILSLVIFGVTVLKQGNKVFGFILLAIASVSIPFAFRALKKIYNNVVKQGFPFKDERSRKLETRAAAWAFYVGIYWLLAISFAIDTWELKIPASSVSSLGIAGMAVVFGLSYWILSRKGNA